MTFITKVKPDMPEFKDATDGVTYKVPKQGEKFTVELDDKLFNKIPSF